MCLLIVQPKQKQVNDDYLSNANDNNPDGIGYAYTTGRKIVTKKYRNYNKFLKSYKKDVKVYSNSPFIIHFRLATHGEHSGVINVHPFKVSDDLVFAHNGIIDVPDHSKYSDTQVFNNTILKKLENSFLNSKALILLIKGFIGTSKLGFLDVNGNTTIINKNLGNSEDGIWYSNTGHKRSVTYGGYNYINSFFKEPNAYTPNKANSDNYYPSPKLSEYKHGDVIVTEGESYYHCDFCRNRADSLVKADLSKYYDIADTDEPHNQWLCLDCADEETIYYNGGF